MKIGIVTLPLHTNYGGILQAYALQTVLERLGHKVEHLQPQVEYPSLHSKWMMPLVWMKRILRKYVGGERQLPVFEDPRKFIRKNTDRFIRSFIKTRYLLSYEWNEKIAFDYDAIVFGSDQIWRPKYVRQIGTYFGDFLGKADVKKIAYAASFGTDELEFSLEQLKECSSLLKSFNGVSVREDTAVLKCQEQLEKSAIQVLDPTMLLSATDYMRLLDLSACHKSSGTLAVYVLDESQQLNEFVEKVAKDKGLISFRVNSKIECSDASILERLQPSVESWIQAFHDAEFVVTDSFHACVFSILFKKPFVCLGNKNRGMSRFYSLLKMFDLEDRLLDISHINEFNLSDINWAYIDEILIRERNESISFIEMALV